MPSGKWRPFCLGIIVLIVWWSIPCVPIWIWWQRLALCWVLLQGFDCCLANENIWEIAIRLNGKIITFYRICLLDTCRIYVSVDAANLLLYLCSVFFVAHVSYLCLYHCQVQFLMSFSWQRLRLIKCHRLLICRPSFDSWSKKFICQSLLMKQKSNELIYQI